MGGEAGAEDRDAGFDDCPDEDVDAVPGRVDRIVVLRVVMRTMEMQHTLQEGS